MTPNDEIKTLYYSKDMFERYAVIADRIRKYVSVAGCIEYDGIKIKTALAHQLMSSLLNQKYITKKKFWWVCSASDVFYLIRNGSAYLRAKHGNKSKQSILDSYRKKFVGHHYDHVFLVGGRNDNCITCVKLFQKTPNSLLIVADPFSDLDLTKKNIPHTNIFFDSKYLAKHINANAEHGINDVLKIHGLDALGVREISGINTYLAEAMIVREICHAVQPKNIIGMEDAMLGKVHESLGIDDIVVETLILDENKISSLHYNAKKILVYGQQGKRCLIKHGVPEPNIIVTGNPILDSLAEYPSVTNSVPRILFATSRLHDGDDMLVQKLADYCKDRFTLTVKLHPKYNGVKNIEMIKRIKAIKGIEFVTSRTSQDLLLESDVLVTDFSSTGIHSRLIGKPTIFYNLTGEDMTHKPDYVDKFVYDLGSLLFQIGYMLDNQQNIDSEFINDFNHSMDGKALDRMLKEIC